MLFLYQNITNTPVQKMSVREKIPKKPTYSIGEIFLAGIADGKFLFLS